MVTDGENKDSNTFVGEQTLTVKFIWAGNSFYMKGGSSSTKYETARYHVCIYVAYVCDG